MLDLESSSEESENAQAVDTVVSEEEKRITPKDVRGKQITVANVK